VTYNTPGTYNVVLTATNQWGSKTITQTNIITVGAAPATPTITANGPTTFCTGGSVVLTSSQATGNVWSNSAGTGASITVTTSGTYSVTYTDGNGCSATSTPTSVSVSNAPIPTVSASATEVCSGDSIVLTSSVADSYLWNNGGETTQSITVTASGTGTYIVTVTNANACDGAGTSSPITVNILPTPVASATYTVNGNVVTFTNTTSNGTSYSWDFGDQSTSIDASPVHTFAANGTYTVVLIATGGNLVTPCTSETAFTITISGVGLDEQTTLTGVVASPNPFTTEVSFEGLTESVEFLLFDMAGKVIAESSITPESSSVELLNLTSGVYFAHLTTSTGARQIVKLIRK
jgi:PKD repeat protein